MSGTNPQSGPELAVTLSLAEWQVAFTALQEAPMPARVTQGVAQKLQQQITGAINKMKANGAMPEAEERP